MEQLLEYLGDRADDFKKCFNIESEWCWKYADLVLRGMEKRELEYGEGHHIVPASFYGKRGCSEVDDGNLTVLTYGEHLWTHYCLVWCATGKMQGKMVKAFLVMYRFGIAGSRPLMPSEAELLDAIPEMEIKRIQAMEPKWAKVEAEGRTHRSEDPKQYMKDYREANREKLAKRKKAYREANREKIAERMKSYCEANREKLAEHRKARYKANREKINARMKIYTAANREKIAERMKSYREANREKIAEMKKARYKANRETVLEQQKARYKANRETVLEHKKAYYEANREKVAEMRKAYREAKKAAGYRDRKDPVTGKHVWVFVGLPDQEVAA
jgi:hypothetical protein